MKAIASSQTAPARLQRQIRGLLGAMGAPELESTACGLFEQMWTAAGLRSPDEIPRWSGVTDDSTPVEFSVQFSERDAAFRILIESQADPPSVGTYWSASQRFTRWLARRWRAQIDAATSIEPLFKPRRGAAAVLAMGHGVEVRREQPTFKVYYNALAQGAERTHDLVGDALRRLGFEKTWLTIRRALRPHDRLELFSLDLTDAVRIKLYVRPLRADLAHLVRLYGLSDASDVADVPRAWEAIHSRTAPERMRPVFVTYNITDPAARRPSRTSLSIPLFPGVANDAEARRRVSALMTRFGVSTLAYRRCVTAMADAPLSREEGIHSYVALQRSLSGTSVVAYFNPRLYARQYGWIARDPARTWPTGVVTAR